MEFVNFKTNMRHRLTQILLLLLFVFIAAPDSFAQTSADTSGTALMKPRIEIGIGRMAFFGDVGKDYQAYGAMTGNIAAHFRFGTPINNYLHFDAYALYGKLSMAETTGPRYLNFSSQIRLTGAGITYNFDNLLKPQRWLSPYVSVGIAGFEFLSKTDLFDSNGNRYHYWSDGSIRNLPENAPNANDAFEIQRNYEYETDIRKLDADGVGSYAERSWAIPVGAGAILNLGEKLDLRVGGDMFLTFTNHIDGVTEAGEGNRKGNAKNDHFFYFNVGMSYNFDLPKGKQPPIKDAFEDSRDYQIAYEDEDSDGIADFFDLCPGTPDGVKVGARGCPVDSDGDGVPDYLDLEPDTPKGAFVDADGVAISDDEFLKAYLFWTDSVYDTQYISSKIETASVPAAKRTQRPKHRTYHVKAQEGTTLSAEMIERILSLPDVTAFDQDGENIFLIGSYDELYKAAERKINLEADGIRGIVVADEAGNIIDLSEESEAIEADLRRISLVDDAYETELTAPTMDVVYRVQIGAFEKPLSKDVFSGVRDLIVLTGTDGLTRYVSGSYSDLKSAADHKVNLLLEGFEGAFITAYRGGKRITLGEAGAIVSGEDDRAQEVSSPSFDTSKIQFRIQIAAYRDEVPTNVLDQFIEIGNIKPVRTADNTTKYLFGEFDSYEEAIKAKESKVAPQFSDAFVVGDFNGQIISAQEAIQMLKE